MSTPSPVVVVLRKPGDLPDLGLDLGEWLETQVPGARVHLCSSEDECMAHLDADALASFAWCPPSFMAGAANLKWVHTLSAGVDSLVSSAVLPSRVTLTNSRGMHAIAIADHAFALVLGLARRLPQCLANQQQAQWERYSGDELHGRTLAIIGFGGIGQEVGRRGRAFGMHVIGIRSRPEPSTLADEVVGPGEMLNVLSRSDIVVLAVPLTPSTRDLIDRDAIAKIKRGAYLINVCRGEVVDQDALMAALRSGRIAGAGLDAVTPEPLPPTSPLWRMQNVVITPHSAALTPGTTERLRQLLATNLKRFAYGEELVNVVDLRRGY
jgi:D-2-hydroxyacid dehydrogenase (NADP+)